MKPAVTKTKKFQVFDLVKKSTKLAPPQLAIIWHPDCSKHLIPNHPEQPRRVDSILASLRQTFDPSVFREAPLGTDEVISLFHTPRHVAFVRDVFTNAGGQWDAESRARAVEAPQYRVHIDGDTAAIAHTGAAAYRAVGAVINAVDEIYSGTSPVK